MNIVRCFRNRFPVNLSRSEKITSDASGNYQNTFHSAISEPEKFWGENGSKIKWFKQWDKVLLNPTTPNAKWFHGGLMNTAYNCLDRHVDEGYSQNTAVIYDSPITNSQEVLTYAELLKEVSLFAGILSRDCNVQKGDRVLIYMPMVVQCMVAMLACARIGAIHTVVFGGFSAEQLSSRIQSAKPKVIVSASYSKERERLVAYKPAVDDAIKLSGLIDCVEHRILYNRPEFERVETSKKDGWSDWDELMQAARPHDAIPVESDHPLYILYTSGTTGAPKGIVRTNGGHAVALKYTMSNVFGLDPGERFWAASEFGWVVGHSFCCYGPLLNRNTTILYEGKPVQTPDAAQFFRILNQYQPSAWYTTPSALRSIRREDPHLTESESFRRDLPKLRNVFVVGEHCDVETLTWLRDALPSQVRLSDSWWQTETGWPMTSSCFGLTGGYAREQGVTTPARSAGRPVPGYNICLSETEPCQADPASEGDHHEPGLNRILVKLPLPPGTAATFWNDHERFEKFYFESYPGYYDSMDVGHIDEEGYVYVLSRADDVINVAGHRLSTSAIEEACYSDEDVTDCAVIAVPHEVKGCVPMGLLVVKNDCTRKEEQIVTDAIAAVRHLVGPVASFNLACVVPGLPKTRSGKIARGSLANMAAGKPVKIPPTIEDPTIYTSIYEAFKEKGLRPTKPDIE